MAFFLAVMMFSLAGIPPTGGFFAKLGVTRQKLFGQGAFAPSPGRMSKRCLADPQRTHEPAWLRRRAFNFRLSGLQAAIGLAQLERIEEFLEENQCPVLALYEGSWLRVEGETPLGAGFGAANAAVRLAAQTRESRRLTIPRA